MLRVSNLQIHYNGSPFFTQEVHFEVNQGEKAVLTGNSGTGKSTILKAILNLTPYTGRIQVDVPFSFLLVDNYFYPDETVFENFYHYYGSINARVNVDKMEKLLEKLEPGTVKKYAKDCSYGTLRRLSFYRAFFLKRKLFIVDEPTLGCDTKKVNLIQSFLNLQKTYLASTHEPILLRSADKLFVLSQIFSQLNRSQEIGFFLLKDPLEERSECKPFYISNKDKMYIYTTEDKNLFELVGSKRKIWKEKEQMGPFVDFYLQAFT